MRLHRSACSRLGLLFLSSLFVLSARAAVITTSDLPGTIQSCIATATCSVLNASSYDSGTASAFQISKNTGSGVETDWLMRYALVPPSGQSTINPSTSDSFSGYLWMLAKSSYSATETDHAFTLYLDKIAPTPFAMAGHSGDLSLSMPTADVVAGSSYVTDGIGSDFQSYSYGNLSGDIPLGCLDVGCEDHAQLNLLQMTYTNFRSAGLWLTSFDATDTRGLVFAQRSSYSSSYGPEFNFDNAQSFYVNAVPLPGAAWLLVSGMVGLGGAARSAKRGRALGK